MGRLDPKLEFLRQRHATASEQFVEYRGTPLRAELVHILVWWPHVDLSALSRLEFRVASRAGDVLAGFIPESQLAALDALAETCSAEGPRTLAPELDVSVGDICSGGEAQRVPGGALGAKALIGIFDLGIDFRHDSFRNGDGSTRLLALWDQDQEPVAGETQLSPFGYGVIYTRDQINDTLHGGAVVRHLPIQDHGTQVAGIACGNGRASDASIRAGIMVGVAPDMDFVVVTRRSSETLHMPSALDAANFLFGVAATAELPMAMNMSLGDDIGPHDGSGLLERAFDNLLDLPGRAIIKSVGNTAEMQRHASGVVHLGEIVDLAFEVPRGDGEPDTLDIWYAGTDRIDVRITPPGNGAPSKWISPGAANAEGESVALSNGNIAFITSTTDDPLNHDCRIGIQLLHGERRVVIADSMWRVHLRGADITSGRFDAWITRGGGDSRPTFSNLVDPRNTITNPGCARRVVTVGAYQSPKSSPGGARFPFSSIGPTRDGKPKPDVCAPGQSVTSTCGRTALEQNPIPRYREAAPGTSMAAPHVTGTVAAMLRDNPALKADDIIEALKRTARADAATGPTPSHEWGAGKLNALGALAAVSTNH